MPLEGGGPSSAKGTLWPVTVTPHSQPRQWPGFWPMRGEGWGVAGSQERAEGWPVSLPARAMLCVSHTAQHGSSPLGTPGDKCEEKS